MPPRSPDTGSALAGHFGRNEWTLSSETAGHLHPKRVVTYAEIHSEWRRLRAWDLKQEGWKQREIEAALGVT